MDYAVLISRVNFRFFNLNPKLSDSEKKRFDYTFVRGFFKLNEGDRDHLMDGRKQCLVGITRRDSRNTSKKSVRGQMRRN